ncbi:MAG: hypothetical protein AB7O62_00100 [Pirellulales bacterium]
MCRQMLWLPVVALNCALVVLHAHAADSVSAPRPLPVTRPEMKELIEDMKGRTPRIPLPELTAEERAKEAADSRSIGYEGRLRSLYLPDSEMRGSLSFGGAPRGGSGAGTGGNRPPQETDPALTLDYRFKTMLFWIASRTNNCQYCLGHQESKLLSAGMAEDEIAALDSEWEAFPAADRAAFALARRLTLEPNNLTDADIDRCRDFFTDVQILEMVLSVAGNNSINRWKEGVGVPQSSGGGNFGRRTVGASPARDAAESERHSYLTATSKRFQTAISSVAPLIRDQSGQATTRTESVRPKLESPAEVQEKLAAAATRSARLPVLEEDAARQALGEAAPTGPLPQWVRLLANFPKAGVRTINTIRINEEKGDLSPLTKARLSWVIARQDRAWYALAEAKRRLLDLGQTEEQIFAIDADDGKLPPTEQALLVVARNLAASPVVLTDQQVATAVELAGPRDVVQAINYITGRAAFDRFTEAAALPIE